MSISIIIFIINAVSITEERCVQKVAVHLDLWEAAKSAVYCDPPRTLNELKTAITAFIRNISQADLQIKLNRFRPVLTLVDITSNAFCKCTATFRMLCIKSETLPENLMVQIMMVF
jgi:hypothetical protein